MKDLVDFFVTLWVNAPGLEQGVYLWLIAIIFFSLLGYFADKKPLVINYNDHAIHHTKTETGYCCPACETFHNYDPTSCEYCGRQNDEDFLKTKIITQYLRLK